MNQSAKQQLSAKTSTDLLARPASALSKPTWQALVWHNSRVHLLVIGLYTIFTLLFTWPLVLHLTDQGLSYYQYIVAGVPWDRDQNLWNLWWFKKSLFELHTNPFKTSFLFYPYGVGLYLHTLGPFNALLAQPFYPFFGWLGAYNLVNLITMVWCGYSGFLLADYLVKDKRAAFVAGFFFTFSPQHLFNLLSSQINVITLQFLALYLLYLIKLDREGFKVRWRGWLYTGLAAICLVICSLSDQYLLLYALIITALYYAGRAITSRKWREVSGLLARTLPALLLGGLILSPYLWATWRAIDSGLFGKTENPAVPSDFVALFLPPAQNLFLGAANSDLGRNFFIQPDVRGISVGLVGLVIALVAMVRERGARWWGILVIITVVLAMGSYPSLKTYALDIPLPGRWLNELPVFKVMRYSRRWLGPTSLAIGICAAYFVVGMFRRFKSNRVELKRWALVIGLLLIFTLEVEPWPIALTGEADKLPRAYAANVLPKTDNRPLLELPFRQKNIAKSSEMYYQTAHERPMLGGYLSRAYKFEYNDTPFSFFVDGYNPEARDFMTVKPEQMRGLLDYYNFGYIAIYKFELDPPVVESWRRVIQQVTGGKQNLFYEDDELIFYRLPDFKSDAAAMQPVLMRGTGWGGLEKRQDGFVYRWIIGPQATLPLFVPPNSPSATYKLTFEAVAYYRDRTLEVRLNGRVLTNLKVGPVPNRFEVTIEGALLKEGDNLLTLDPLEPADKPSERENSNDTRALTLLVGGIQWTKV